MLLFVKEIVILTRHTGVQASRVISYRFMTQHESFGFSLMLFFGQNVRNEYHK